MQHWRCWSYQVCINNDSGLTLTYFMAKSNLIRNAFIWETSGKVHFLVTVKAKIIILARKSNEAMVLYKYQKSG